VKKERRGLGYDPGLIRTRTHKRNSTSHSDKVREKRTIALTKDKSALKQNCQLQQEFDSTVYKMCSTKFQSQFSMQINDRYKTNHNLV